MKNVEDIYELSPTQQGMLFHSLSAPGSGVYFEQFSYQLEGRLDVRAFRKAWQFVAQRHALLRTSFHWREADKLLQVVRSEVSIPWHRENWRKLSKAEQQSRLTSYLEADRAQGFVFETAPLMRLALFHLGGDRHWLVWSFHHMLMDGWSVHIVLREVLTVYEADQQGPDPLLKPVRPYRDYISWIQSQDLAAAKDFWQRSLQGYAPLPSLWCERGRKGAAQERQDVEPGQFALSIDRQATRRLQDCAKRHRVTLNTLVQGAWALLLGRYSDSGDVVYGVTVSGRPPQLQGMESMVGLFINTLPCRVRIVPQADCGQWLRELQAWQAQARRFEYTPLLQVQKWSDLPAGKALFETVLVFENYFIQAPANEERPSSLRVSHLLTSEKMNYALSGVVDPGIELGLRILYDRQRIEPQSAARMTGHFRRLLEGLAFSVQGGQLGRIPLLSQPEQRQLLDWRPASAAIGRFPDLKRLLGTYCRGLYEAACSPSDRQSLLLADDDLQLVPLGLPGRLYCGGQGLVSGFAARPRLTAQRFGPDPFSGLPGGRLFKSGARLRLLPHGEVEDLSGNGTRTADRTGDPSGALPNPGPSGMRLVAYAVVEGDGSESSAELRAYLKERLPEYMVPASFVLLDDLPRLSNGKVNRAALPQPDWSRPQMKQPFVPPSSEAEAHLAQIWSKALGLEKVGIHDDFFELGGDSIISIQITARARESGYDLSPDQIFQFPSIAELKSAGALSKGAACTQQSGRDLNPAQNSFMQEFGDFPARGGRALLLTLQRSLSPALLQEALQTLHNRHDGLRVRFRRQGDAWQQFLDPDPTPVPLTVIDLNGISEAQATELMRSSARQLQSGFDLEGGPLHRVACFAWPGDQPDRLLIVIHGLAADDFSWQLLLEEFESACLQMERNGPVEMALPAASRPFWDWAEPARPASPSDSGAHRPRPPLPPDAPDQSLDGTASWSVELSEEETSSLLGDVSRAYRARIEETLLTGLVQAAAQLLDSEELWIGVQIQLRREDFSRTVGCLSQMIAVRLSTVGCQDAGRALLAVKEKLRGVQHPIGGGEEIPQWRFIWRGDLDALLARSALWTPCPGVLQAQGQAGGGRPVPMQIESQIEHGKLLLHWTWLRRAYRMETVQRLAQAHVRTLQGLIEHCRSSPAGGYSPSDFPLAGLKQPQLDELWRRDPLIEDVYPLSPMQKDMVLHSLAVPDSTLGRMQFCWEVQGRIELTALKEAWGCLIQRHTVFRTSFLWEGVEDLLQVVRKKVEIPWQSLDWRGWPADRQRLELDSLLRSDLEKGFAMDQAPLTRFRAIRVGAQSCYLLWSFHHALLDGWCQSLVLNQLFACYRALAQGRQPRLQPVRPYRDYIAWLQRQDPVKAEEYWRGRLKGFSSVTPIPSGRPRPSGDGNSGSQVRPLSRQATGALQRLARQHRLTLNTLLQGAWAILLAGCSGRPEVVFGVTVSGRPADLAQVEDMVGLFINNLPSRVEVDSQSLIIPWLQQLQSDQIEMRRFEYASQGLISQWSEVPPSRRLYDSILVFENYPTAKSQANQGARLGLRLASHFGTRTASPLSLFCQVSDRLTLQLAYDEGRVEESLAQAALVQLEDLLAEMADAGADRRIADLPSWAEGRLGSQAQPRSGLRDRQRLASPQQVQAALLDHPDVSESHVVERAGSGGSIRQIAYLGCLDPAAVSTRDLRSQLKKRLAGSNLPSDLVVLANLPRKPSGDLDVDALPLPELSLGWGRRNTLHEDLAGRDVLEVQLAQIWEDVFDLRPIDPLDDFFELGGDSMLAVNLVSRIHQHLGFNLPLSALFEGANIRDLAQRLRRQSQTDVWSALALIKPSGTLRPFFAVHPAGGNVLNFTHLARRMEPDRPLYGLQAVGLDGKREPLERVEDMAAHYIEQIQTIQPHGPYLLGGLSFGGYVAYEMACQLHAQGEETGLLAMLETWSPLYHGEWIMPRAFPDEPTILSALVRTAAAIYGREFSLPAEEIRRVEAEKQLDFTLEQIRQANIVPKIGLEQTRRIMRIHQCTVRAGSRYRPHPYPGSITVFRAPVIEPWLVSLNNHPGFGEDELWWGWSGLSSQPLRVHTIPESTHSNFYLEPYVQLLAKHLQDGFREVE